MTPRHVAQHGARKKKVEKTPETLAKERREKRADKGDYDFSKESGLHQFTQDQLELNAFPNVLFMHLGNGLQRPGKAMNMLKNMGVKTGAFDWLVIVHGKAHWLELKKPGKKPSDEQLQFMDKARKAGCEAFVADSPLEVRQILYVWAAINILKELVFPDTIKGVEGVAS